MPADAPATIKRVLLASDDLAYAELLRGALSARGYHVTAVPRQQAAERLQEFEDGVVLCSVGEDASAYIPARAAGGKTAPACVAVLKPSCGPQSHAAKSPADEGRNIVEVLTAVDTHFDRQETQGEAKSADDGTSTESGSTMTDRVKLDFLSKISHELRTPLNAIIGFAEIIVHDKNAKLGPEKVRNFVEDIHNSGRYLLDIINDILDFAKAEAGKLTLQESEANIVEAILAVRRLIGPRARDAGIDIYEDIPEKLPNVWCDERKVKQMLLNLLSNAMKFTPTKGRIDITAEWSTEGLIIGVRDNGIGIAKENLSRIMQPFVQIDSTLARKREGTGLGLALVKAMIELHGGRLTIDSKLNEGTQTRLTFPPERLVERRTADDFAAAPTESTMRNGGRR
jgi:signal transduction histidine kinase